jgi:hypothetical protein
VFFRTNSQSKNISGSVEKQRYGAVLQLTHWRFPSIKLLEEVAGYQYLPTLGGSYRTNKATPLYDFHCDLIFANRGNCYLPFCCVKEGKS